MSQFKWIIKLDGTHLPSKNLIGGKAWSIARMLQLGLSVPPAFVISTEACLTYLEKKSIPDGLKEEIRQGMAWLEQCSGRQFGTGPSPLLISVRSGAAISMPGMMDTILNLGMNEKTMAALGHETGDYEFSKDTYKRFYELFAEIVLKLPDPQLDPHASTDDWREQISNKSSYGIPQNVYDQLDQAVVAVFDSWSSRRAKRYRKHHNIPDSLGTSVTIQAMVFGNLSKDSGTGVLFTRNPLNGSQIPYGEYLPKAQGEDVVSGKYNPKTIDQLADTLPSIHEELMKASDLLEYENGDVQDIEFTVQNGNLYLLQSRKAKRSPQAAIRIAVDLAKEKKISKLDALLHITSAQIRSYLSPRIDSHNKQTKHIIAKGQGASPGIGIGTIVTDSDEADRRHELGEKVILTRPTTSPDDVHGMLASSAVITEQGGTTSHAAVVCRSLGVPCVVGCNQDLTKLNGQTVTVDGSNGLVYEGSLEVITPHEHDDEYLNILLEWAHDFAPIEVYRPGTQPTNNNVVTLNGQEKTNEVVDLLRGNDGAVGGLIASDDGVAAAVEAQLKFIVAEPTLPPLIHAIAIKQNRKSHE